VAGLNRLVHAYQSRGRIERTNAGTAAELERAFPTSAALVVFLAFTVQDVVEAVSEGLLLPAGLTRFIVSPRALRVNYPLEALALEEPREAKEEALTRWVHERVVGRRVRYYAEATYLFDE
ncbi:MAG: Pyridoxal-5'-phosphate-dependent enzyme, beta subunit (modular protein), partial [Anaerolineales bacterium]|nr:Pyridoxal-5'-phosphate-dependent enzyme, beta subunit (modular protein) [Anaerolineales bacterium]